MRRASVCFTLLALLATPALLPAGRAHAVSAKLLREDDGNLLNAVDAANRSILTVVGYPMRYGPPRPGKKLRRLIGTAVVVSEHRILTTASMALPDGTLHVLLGDGKEAEAKLLGVDHKSNLALFDVRDQTLPALRRATPQSVAVGTWVAVISNVAITRPQAALGRVVGRGERIDSPYAGEVVEIDAPTYLGATGAAVLNEEGEWIGLVVGRAESSAADPADSGNETSGAETLTPQPNSLLLALPVDEVDRISADLAQYGSVRQAFLGVGLMVGGLADTLGVRVVKVMPGSPADSAGLRIGDRILAIEGQEMRRPDEITSFVRSMRPGEEMNLTLLRESDIMPLTVVLGSVPTEPPHPPRKEEIRALRQNIQELRDESRRMEERLKTLESTK